MSPETLEDHLLPPATAAGVLHEKTAGFEASIVASFDVDTIPPGTAVDLQQDRIAALYEQRAELLMELSGLRRIDADMDKYLKNPANYLMCAIELMVDHCQQRTALSRSLTGELNTYAAVVETPTENTMSPRLMMRISEAPNEAGELEPRFVAVATELRENENHDGRFIFTTSHKGAFKIFTEYWHEGMWRRAEVVSQSQQFRLVQALALELTDAFHELKSADAATHQRVRRQTHHWVKTQQYLV